MEPREYQTLYRQEEEYWWYRALRRLVAEEVEGALAARRAGERPPRILDAGCGTGGMLLRLEASAHGIGTPTLHGTDCSRLALSLARRRGPFALSAASVDRLPYRSGSFDLIVSLDVLYHRQVTSDSAALREFARCLRPGGVVVLNLPAYEWLRSSHDAAIHTARRYHRAGLRRLLTGAGLRVERITYWNTLLFPGLAAVRLLRRHARPGHENGSGPASDVRPVAAPLNRLLEEVLRLERLCLKRTDLPFGLSLLALAEKPEDPA